MYRVFTSSTVVSYLLHQLRPHHNLNPKSPCWIRRQVVKSTAWTSTKRVKRTWATKMMIWMRTKRPMMTSSRVLISTTWSLTIPKRLVCLYWDTVALMTCPFFCAIYNLWMIGTWLSKLGCPRLYRRHWANLQARSNKVSRTSTVLWSKQSNSRTARSHCSGSQTEPNSGTATLSQAQSRHHRKQALCRSGRGDASNRRARLASSLANCSHWRFTRKVWFVVRRRIPGASSDMLREHVRAVVIVWGERIFSLNAANMLF